MGIDTTIVALNEQAWLQPDTMANWEEFYASMVAHAHEADVPAGFVSLFEARLKAVRKLERLLEDLDAPPSVNDVDVYQLIENATYCDAISPRFRTALGLVSNSSVVGRYIPQYLAERWPETGALWYRLVGNADTAEDLADLAPPYTITLGDQNYEVTYARDSPMCGFLQGEELEALAAGLRPVLADLDDLYEYVAAQGEKYDHVAQLERPLEVVHAMATHYAGGDSILAVYFD